MPKVLGLDLGTNSIGWALIDKEAREIIDAGVRVFPEGVNIKSGSVKEESKNAARREARQARRQTERRNMRKNHLKHSLQRLGFLPEEEIEVEKIMTLNPYEVRKKGLYRKLSSYEFGRALFHLNQRRGFKSNRKMGDNDDSKIFQGMEGKTGITETEEEIMKGGFKTLGEYLASLDSKEVRKRNRYTLRRMYEDEFEKLWNVQAKHHPQIVNNNKKEIKEAIFYQRKLKSQKHLVTNCPFETNKKATPLSSLSFQYFRIFLQISNIRISIFDRYETPLTPDERNILVAELMQKPELKFNRVRKLLNLPVEAHINLEDNKNAKLLGNRTEVQFVKVFGKNRWNSFSSAEKEIVWNTFFFADDSEWLEKYVTNKWNLDQDNRDKIAKVFLESGYGRYSSKAIQKILPGLRKGLSLYDAVREAGYKSENMEDAEENEVLKEPENLRNPIVIQSLFELRKLVNALVQDHGKPDIVRVELAREMRKSKANREDLRRKNFQREIDMQEIRERLLEDFGIVQPSREDVQKYMLWEECNQQCVYTGKTISLEKLFTGEFQIEHIIPRSRNFDNSLFNKTLCHRDANLEKGNRTPYEAYAPNEALYNEILVRVAKTKMDYKKKRLFEIQELEGDFISRQLNDTGYISKETKKYLQSVFPKVQAVKGGMTAELRHYWGLNSILGNTDMKSRDDHRHHTVDALVVANTTAKYVKRLSDHYEYIDYDRYTGKSQKRDFPFPWQGFRDDAQGVIKNIFVSHKFKRKTTGQLHEDTIYGQVNTAEGEQYVVRKSLESLTAKQITNIVDPVVKGIVLDRLEALGVSTGNGKFSVPKDAFIEPLYMSKTSPKNNSIKPNKIKKVRVFVPASNMVQLKEGQKRFVEPGNNHHIVIFENEENEKRDGEVVSLFEVARRKRFKEPLINTQAKPGWKFVMSLSINEMVLLDVDEKGIDWDDPYLATHLNEKLYRVQKMTVSGQIFFRHHIVARLQDDKKNELGRESRMPNTLKGVKVKIDPLGRISKADD